jgi:DMSO/TMAO reductase YedYZ molybdopterin-dependent catalytic subunit
MLCLLSIDSGWAQDKTGGAAGANAQAEDYLDLRGDVPNPRRIDTSELKKLPRLETRTTDPHDPGKEIIYSGTPLVEVLKAGGLRLDSDTARIRETVAITVLVEATDGYRAVFALAELDPELTDRVILLADTKDGQPLSPSEGAFRVIVPGEKRPARWVRQVRALTVHKN